MVAKKGKVKEEKSASYVESVLEDISMPSKIHGRDVLRIDQYSGKYHITDVDRTIYSLPENEYELWRQGKLYA